MRNSSNSSNHFLSTTRSTFTTGRRSRLSPILRNRVTWSPNSEEQEEGTTIGLRRLDKRIRTNTNLE